MKNSTRLAAALVAAFIWVSQIPLSAAPLTFTILDQYVTGRGAGDRWGVPTGTTSYQNLTYYTQYVDAGSVDASPFVIDLLTSPRQNETGILFYTTTELISKDQANTFRLTSTTGLFDFTSFNLQDLEPYVDDYTATSIPTINITSSTGFSRTFSATFETMEFDFDGETFVYSSYFFMDSGVKEMDWLGVDWVDFTTQHTKAKTSDFVMALSDFSAGTINLTANNGTVAEVSGTATVNISGANVTIAEVSGGTVNVNAAGATIQLYNGGNVSVGDGLAVAMQNGTSSGVISGDGGLIKNSSGALALGGVNTYTGATTVAAGQLVVDGSAANSTVTVQNGGTLAGSGTVGGIVLNLGSTISPGNSPGTTSVAGNVVWNPGANYNWQIYDATLGAGTGWDWISATGSLDLAALTVGSQFNINLWSLNEIGPDVNGNALNFDPNQNYTWTILTATGGISGFTGTSQFLINTGAINGTAGFANSLNGGTFSVVQNSNDLNLVFTAASAPIPEPGTWAAAALLAGATAFMRWRKRAKAP